MPLLPLYFSPEKVESNSVFDGFIRMKISTLTRKKEHFGDREKRKVKMVLFPSFILLVSARQRNMKFHLSAHSFKILNKPEIKAK